MDLHFLGVRYKRQEARESDWMVWLECHFGQISVRNMASEVSRAGSITVNLPFHLNSDGEGVLTTSGRLGNVCTCVSCNLSKHPWGIWALYHSTKRVLHNLGAFSYSCRRIIQQTVLLFHGYRSWWCTGYFLPQKHLRGIHRQRNWSVLFMI